TFEATRGGVHEGAEHEPGVPATDDGNAEALRVIRLLERDDGWRRPEIHLHEHPILRSWRFAPGRYGHGSLRRRVPAPQTLASGSRRYRSAIGYGNLAPT